MSEDLFVDEGLHALHEWPEAQDQVLALLAARREAAVKGEIQAGGVIVPVETRESPTERDS